MHAAFRVVFLNYKKLSVLLISIGFIFQWIYILYFKFVTMSLIISQANEKDFQNEKTFFYFKFWLTGKNSCFRFGGTQAGIDRGLEEQAFDDSHVVLDQYCSDLNLSLDEDG